MQLISGVTRFFLITSYNDSYDKELLFGIIFDLRLAIPRFRVTRFFLYKQHFYKQRQAELLLFENYSRTSFTLSSKNNMTYSKK